MYTARELITHIAKQKLFSELDEDDQDCADVEGAYDYVVGLCRDWLVSPDKVVE